MTSNGSLDSIFRPRSIAVVGASRSEGSIGGAVFWNLLKNRFQGPVYPVHPSADSVHSVRAWPSIEAVPGGVDLAVIVVPAAKVESVIDDCIAKPVRGVVILSAGFAETGPEGLERQRAIVEKLRSAGIRLVGPNCLGVLNTAADVAMDATFAPTWPPVGNVAFSSQSGALGLAILDYAFELGIGISNFISVGNKADVSGNDLIEYWEKDPATDVILLYLESFGNPRHFLEIARRVSRSKPIAVVKSGRTSSGARAASSHTGALASQEIAVKALLHQTGVIRTDTIEQLFDMAMLLANQPIPRGRRVGILTNAGGPGIMASDACESHGLEVAELSADTVRALREILPAEAAVRNPVDMIASATAESFEAALRLILADDEIDSTIVLFVPPVVTEASHVADAIRRGAAGSDKPVLTCFMGTHGVPPALSSLHEGKIPSYAFPEAAAIALARAARHGEWLERDPGVTPSFDQIEITRGRDILRDAAPGWLGSAQIESFFATWGLPVLETKFAASPDEARMRADELGGPVALKIASDTITHKSDVGGVLLDLATPEQASEGFVQIRKNLEAAVGSSAEMKGVIVQPMAPEGVELFAGITRDPAFGPIIAFGIGGTFVELWKDIAFRIAPLTDVDAKEMLDSIHGKALLDGFRGSPAADRAAVEDVLLRLSAIAVEHPEIAELDINPLVALPPGRGARIVDARVRIEKEADRAFRPELPSSADVR